MDRPLKEIFNAPDDQLASIDARKIKISKGKYSFKYLGENVTVYLEEGIFKTGYGDYVYTYDELLKLLGDE